jgi:hypothetical protein
MTILLDPQESQRRKEAGQQLALDIDQSWQERIVAEFKAWAAKRVAMGLRVATIEEFRASTVCQPQSHKAWGSLPRLLVKAGLIRPQTHPDGSPVYVKAAAVKTHSHPVRQWVLAGETA